MARHSFTFSSSILPAGALLSAAIILVAELVLFPKSYLVADKSTLSLTRTAALLDRGPDPDLAIIGASRSLAIDAKLLQDELAQFNSVYNYSVPSLGTTLQFAMTLEKLLDNHRRPKALLISLSPEIFGDPNFDALLSLEPERQRLRRVFSLRELFEYMPSEEKLLIAPTYLQNILNSLNYRVLIKGYLDYVFFGVDPFDVGDPISRNKALIDHMKATNGQMLYWAGREVADDDVPVYQIVPFGCTVCPEVDGFYLSRHAYIYHVLGLANEKEIPVIVFMMPIHEKRFMVMQKYGNFKYIAAAMQAFEREFPNVLFLEQNLKFDKRFFGDLSHLNAKGARIFNKHFLAAVKRLFEQGYGYKQLSDEGLFFDIGSPVEGKVYLQGFDVKEHKGATWRWNQGSRSTFIFPWLRSKEPRRYRVTIDVQPYVAQQNREMELASPVESVCVLLTPGRRKYSVDLLFPAGEDLTLSAQYAAAVSPFDLGRGQQKRELAVAWFGIGLHYASPP